MKSKNTPEAPTRPWLRLVLICLGLVLITAWLYAPVQRHEFIELDDPDYVIQNPPVRSGVTVENISWAFTHAHSGNWHPLTWVSHMIDCQWWGLDPGKHHRTSLVLHTLNTTLLFLVLCQMTGATWRSALVAAFFAWHPLHVESVAWVAERKDVLSAFFWIATLGAYAWYVRRPSWRRYLGVAVGLALGLMSKPMVVTLPFVLLLLDFWPLGRWKPEAVRSLLREKVPLFLLVGISCAVTIWAQKQASAVASIEAIPLYPRLANALVGYATYLGKTVWPSGLSIYYPYQASLPLWQVIGAAALLAALTILVLRTWRRAPSLAMGWLWFLGTLVPVIGLVQVGNQAMADRYTYIPLIGVFIMLVWGGAQLVAPWKSGPAIGAGLGAIAVAACLWMTSKELPYWRESVSLFEHSLANAPGAAPLHNNLANVLLAQGKIAEAEAHAREAVRLVPRFSEAHNNLARALNSQGQFPEGILHLEEAVRLDPNGRSQLVNLALIRSAHPNPAWRDGAQAVALASHASDLAGGQDATVLDLLAMGLAEDGRFAEALRTAETAHEMAVSATREPLARAIAMRLALYRQGRPYRVPFGG